MKTLLIAAVLTAFVFTASADVVKIPKEKPIASVNFPAKWKVEVDEDSIDATSPDEEISIYIESHDDGSIENAIKETFEYLAKEKVTVEKKSEVKTELKSNGMDVVDFSWDGKDEDGPAKISLDILFISKDKILLLLYWASPEGQKKNAADLKTIFSSIKPVK